MFTLSFNLVTHAYNEDVEKLINLKYRLQFLDI
jgi:hypothetical protein